MKPIRQRRGGCRQSESRISRHLGVMSVENEVMPVMILPDKGADIHALRYKPEEIDVLWKAHWEVKEPGIGVPTAVDSATVWLEDYSGGWQEIVPNAGDPCTYKGVELSFHGEASLLPWSYEVLEHTRQRVTVRFSMTLYRSPFTLVRTMGLEEGKPVLVLAERVVNEAAEEMDFMWGHHPAYGAPFLSEACVIDTGATTIQADDRYDPPSNFLTPGRERSGPEIVDKEGRPIDTSHVPSPHEHMSCLAYLKNFNEGWYAITNTKLGFGIGLVWPKEIFPYAYL